MQFINIGYSNLINASRIISIVSAIIGRISHKSLENNGIRCLCIEKQKGLTV